MIYVLELDDPANPRAWFAFDLDDLLAKVAGLAGQPAWAVWDCRSACELLELFDERPDAPGVAERYPGIWAMGQAHGWDTPLYRADSLLEPGAYRAEPVRREEACAAALRVRGEHRIYWSDEAAVAAADDARNPSWQGPGWRAHRALCQQLFATEAMFDPG